MSAPRVVEFLTRPRFSWVNLVFFAVTSVVVSHIIGGS